MSHLFGKIPGGARLVVEFSGQTLECPLTRAGEFRVEVPPGEVTLRAGNRRWRVELPEGEHDLAGLTPVVEKQYVVEDRGSRIDWVSLQSASLSSLLCVIPYCRKDVEQAGNLLNWMRELGSCPEHLCVLVADCKVPEETNAEVLKLARRVFADVILIRPPHAVPEGWPQGPNWMFQTACAFLHDWFGGGLADLASLCRFLAEIVGKDGEISIEGDHLYWEGCDHELGYRDRGGSEMENMSVHLSEMEDRVGKVLPPGWEIFKAYHDHDTAWFSIRRVASPKPPHPGPLPQGGEGARAATRSPQSAILGFFWCEPDCIPLRPGWLDALGEGYRAAATQYMGAIVSAEGVPRHMTGCGVYPINARQLLGEVTGPVAWDVVCAEEILPRCQHTRLIANAWGSFAQAPTFDGAAVEKIPGDAVVLHRNKDGTLIQHLRRARNLQPVYVWYEEIAGLTSGEDLVLFDLFADSFARHGFKVVCLNDSHARSHPAYQEIVESDSLSNGSPNGRAYLTACYLRWLAVSNQARNGERLLMADWDVINYGVTASRLNSLTTGNRLVTFSGAETPCLVFGRKPDYERVIAAFLEYARNPVPLPDGPSDQNILKTVRDVWDGDVALMADLLCLEFPKSLAWPFASWVHYPHLQGRDRGRGVLKLRPWSGKQ